MLQKWKSASRGSPIGQKHSGAPFPDRAAVKAGWRWILGIRFGNSAGLGFVCPVERRMGEGLDGRLRRCVLPMTAFFEIPRTLPMCAVVCPAVHNRFSSAIRSSVQVMFVPNVFL